MILDLIKKARTYRHFEDTLISEKIILNLIEAARYSSAAKNQQVLRFAYTLDDDKCRKIFENVSLGGALKKDEKPTIDERARAVVAIISKEKESIDSNSLYFNLGIAAQNIILTANDNNLNSCIVMAFNKKEVENILEIPSSYSIKTLILLGKGKEKIEIIDAENSDETKYYRENSKHYVPKIKLEDLILNKN